MREQGTVAEKQSETAASARPHPVEIYEPRTIFTKKWEDARQYLIHHLPRGVLNNSSNLVGGMQLFAELFMFKSSNNNLIDPENKGKPLHYLIDPPRNIVRGSFQRSKFQHPWTDIFKPAKVLRELNDLEGAALRDAMGGTVKLTNRWSARAGFAGMTSMALSTFLPEHSETAEETMVMVDMRHDHPLQYMGVRLKQALNPIEVYHNKRPLVGLGMTAAGFFSVLSGFRQVEGKFALGETQMYRRNPWQMLGGAITMAAGSQLFMGVNNEQGWRSFGTTQLLRFATLPGSIGSRYSRNPVTGHREAGAGYYFAAQSILAVKNTIASLIGGVQIDENGTIIDHAQMRREAVAHEKEERMDRKDHAKGSPLRPLPRITHVAAAERASPPPSPLHV